MPIMPRHEEKFRRVPKTYRLLEIPSNSEVSTGLNSDFQKTRHANAENVQKKIANTKGFY
jgi:hypothetical protein